MAASNEALPRIVILGAGLGGTIAAFEAKDAVKHKADVSVISDSEHFSFVPSNPWVALRWREPDAIQVALRPVFDRKKIGFVSTGARRVLPEQNRIELNDGSILDYDYLVIATGPDLAFDEVKGSRPAWRFQYVGLSDRACGRSCQGLRCLCRRSRADRHRGGAGRILLWPGI